MLEVIVIIVLVFYGGRAARNLVIAMVYDPKAQPTLAASPDRREPEHTGLRASQQPEIEDAKWTDL